jgi:hypothetical protein
MLSKFKGNWKSYLVSKIEYSVLVASLILNFWTRRLFISYRNLLPTIELFADSNENKVVADQTPKDKQDLKKSSKSYSDVSDQSAANKETIIMLLHKSNEGLAPPNLLPYSLQLLPEIGQSVKAIKDSLLAKGQDSIKAIAKLKGKETKGLDSKAITLLRLMCQFGEKISEVCGMTSPKNQWICLCCCLR